MTLPYIEKNPPKSWAGWQKLESNDLAHTELIKLSSELSEFARKSILEVMQDKVIANPNIIAICLITSGAWGYTFQDELIQLKDGSFIHQVWNDNTNEIMTTTSLKLELDLRKEINNLCNENIFVQNSGENKNSELKSGLVGRSCQMYFVVGKEIEWLTWPKPNDGKYENNAPNRIFKALYQKNSKLELI